MNMKYLRNAQRKSSDFVRNHKGLRHRVDCRCRLSIKLIFLYFYFHGQTHVNSIDFSCCFISFPWLSSRHRNIFRIQNLWNVDYYRESLILTWKDCKFKGSRVGCLLTIIANMHRAVLVYIEILRRFGNFNSMWSFLCSFTPCVLIYKLVSNIVSIETNWLKYERPGLILWQRCIERPKNVVQREAIAFVRAELQATVLRFRHR